MSRLSKPYIFSLFYLIIFMKTSVGKHFTTIELENLKNKTVLVKLDLANITEFTSQDTVSAIFFYRTLTEIVWIEWLEKSLPIIHPIQVGIVDCDSDENYNAKKDCFDLGFNPPSIRIYRYGYIFSEYNEENNARSFVKHIQKIIPNELIRLDDLNEFERFLNETNQSVIVGFFRNETVLEEIFIKVAQEFHGVGVIFGYSSNEQVLKLMNLFDNITLFRPKYLENAYEENFINYTGKTDLKSLKNFIKTSQHGLVGIRTYFNVDDFPKPQIITYFDLNIDLKKIRELILPVAEEFKNITFAVSDKKAFTDDLIEFGIETKRIFYSKVLVLAQTEKNYKYILDEFKTVQHLRDFADGFEKKTLAQFIKTQDLKHSMPHSETSLINLAVGRNFLQLVNKNSKDLLVLLFNFDCFQTLISMDFTAKEFQNESDKVGFLAMNVHLNDVPHPFYFNRCPTIFFAGRGFKNNPVLYGGYPDYKKLYRFMREQRVLHDKKRT